MSEKSTQSNFRWKYLFLPIIFAASAALLFQIFNQNFEVKRNRPKYVLYNGINRRDLLVAVDRVLTRLGLEKIEINGSIPSEIPANWNVLWSFIHPFRYKESINWTSLKHTQKINHFPGNIPLISKYHLTTQWDFDFIPKGFLTSDDVQKYSAQHPDKRFVVKLKANRGVKLTKPSDMNYTAPVNQDDYFAQEYVENPLLWDGHKFDFAIFVAITSVDPLRFYYYNKNVNLRFCLKPYDTRNVSDVDSYVIGTEHISGQSFPYVKRYIEAGYTYRDAFEAFIKEVGGNVEEIWKKTENLIRSVVLTKEKSIIEAIHKQGTNKYSFFELYRFDMIFDKHFNLYLLEVNMSPNILATKAKIHNRLMFENVLYNLFNMLGIGSYHEKSSLVYPNYATESMVVYHDALTIKPEICMKPPCIDSCDDVICKFCWKCLEKNRKYEMIQSFIEQMSRGYFVRLFPVPKEKIMEKLWTNVTETNRFYIEWFQEMCKKNDKFC